MNDEHVIQFKKSDEDWNKWRLTNPKIKPNLRNLDFMSQLSTNKFYDLPTFRGRDFSESDLNSASLRDCFFINCNFDNSKLNFSDLVNAYFDSCSFKNISMRVCKIGSAKFNECHFENTDMSYCSAENTSFEGSNFLNSRLEKMELISCDFTNTRLSECLVYGISSWDLKLRNSIQENLIITKEDQPIITVDNIELAQFLYLIINNSKLRNVIDTITSKVVLILGNFSVEKKIILDKMREYLRKKNFIPVMFDFEKPSSRNFTETVITLANLSKFIIADLSSPRCIPHELGAIIPKSQSVSFYPIILENERPYAMFDDLRVYPNVNEIKEYKSSSIDTILEEIVHEQSS